MLNKKNALCLLWVGNEIPDRLVISIKDLLVGNGITIPEMLTIVYKDEDGIAQSLIKEANGVSTIRFDITDKTTEDAFRRALAYIGERFEVSLSNTKAGLVPFALDLQSQLSKARNNISFNPMFVKREDKLLNDAITLIATTNIPIPQGLKKKLRITEEVRDTIKQIYNQFA